MTSYQSIGLPSSFSSVSTGVRDVIESYRRAQYLAVDSRVISSEDEGADDEESTLGIDEDLDENDEDIREGADLFDWEEENIRPHLPQAIGVPSTPFLPSQRSNSRIASEATSLLRGGVAFAPQLSRPPYDQRPPITRPRSNIGGDNEDASYFPSVPKQPVFRPVTRRISSGSVAQSYYTRKLPVGRSTFGQTLFNSTAILLGIGILSEPLAFSYAGWIAGTVLIIFYGFISCYTAKILARVILADPKVKSYSDIGRKAFGTRATLPTSIMFCLELFSVSVVLVTLYADSLHSIIPSYSSNTYKLYGLILLIPTVFMPLSLLSYTSILGIGSIVMLVVVIIIDGLSKYESPGSIWQPAETSFSIAGPEKLALAFGLYMAGFSGHAVIPSLVRDMADPTQFDSVVNWAFIVATFVYSLIGFAGYLMFGNAVSEEVSLDLLQTPGYNPVFNQAALWMLVISPLSKFALTTQPLNTTIEILLGLESTEHAETTLRHGFSIPPKKIARVLQRVVITCLSVATSILVPEFSSMMAFLGSFAAFMICIIGPVGAKIALEGRCSVFDGAILAVAVLMAAWGTLAAFYSV